MSIKKLNSGRFQITYVFNKKKKRESFDTITEAKIRLLEISAERLKQKNNSGPDDNKTTIQFCANAWVNWLKSRNRSPKYIKRIHAGFNHIFPFLKTSGIIYVAQLNKFILDGYFKFRKEQGARQQTIINEYRMLHAALAWAQSRDIILVNKIAKYKPEPAKHRIPRVPTPEEIQKIFDNLPSLDTKKIFYFILAIGSRYAETIELRADDIQDNTIKFHRATKLGYIRYVKLPELPFKLPKKGLLFTFQKHKWTSNTLLSHIQKACKKANVPKINIHTLRHAHATYSLIIGGQENSLQEILVRCGWRSLDMLTRYMDKNRTFHLTNINKYLPDWKTFKKVDTKWTLNKDGQLAG